MPQPSILLCTAGTSLFRPNLEGLKKQLTEGTLPPEFLVLAEAYRNREWEHVAQALAGLSPTERSCGAEINSIASMIERDHVRADCGLYFLHSDTEDGRQIGKILCTYFQNSGHTPVRAIAIEDLQDKDPRRFRTRGLRHLAREICRIIRDHTATACAINATGGYKAQIAIAVLLGQALGVPVFYKHEFFSEIIAFPPMPVALDFEVWMRASGMLFDLERSQDVVPVADFADEWDPRYESLVERIAIDGQDYLELSPTGQIFHETFRQRFQTQRDQVLPPPALQKRPPHLEKAGWPGTHPEVEQFLQRLTAAIPCVQHCATFYYHPTLPKRTRFVVSREGIVGIFSPASYTVRFRVETTAQTDGQRAAVVAVLNEWLSLQR